MILHLRCVHFFCDTCNRFFSNKSNLTKHDRRKHSKSFSEKNLQTIASFNTGDWLCVACERFFDQVNQTHDCALIGRELVARKKLKSEETQGPVSVLCIVRNAGENEDGETSGDLDMGEFLCFPADDKKGNELSIILSNFILFKKF